MNKKTIDIYGKKWFDCQYMPEWKATYAVYSGADTKFIYIEARSTIELLVAKVYMPYRSGEKQYLISSPNFGVALPDISTLQETHWITEKLLLRGMPVPDAVTAAQVLADMGNF